MAETLSDYSAELMEKLKRQMETLFTQEWGGPRSDLALNYLREHTIPRLLQVIIRNHRFLENRTFIDILTNKLNTEFGYPITFAEGLARDIVSTALKVLGKHPFPQNHIYQPWEIILRMLTIGLSIKEISDKTGFSESYIETFRLKYINFYKIAQHTKSGAEYFLTLSELSGYGSHLIRFFVDFKNRFSVFNNYLARLHAEQIIFDLSLPLDADNLLRLLEEIYKYDGQLSKDELICHFVNRCKINLNTNGVLRCPQKGDHVKVIIDNLLANNLLIETGGIKSRLSLSPRAGSLAAVILAPKLADEIISLLRSGRGDRAKQAEKLLLNKNREVVVQVIKELVQKKDANVLVLFKMLYHKVNKTVLLEIIAGCGELGDSGANIILTKSLQNRDSMVRVKACQAIKKLADKSYYFQLIKTLQDPVPLVREHAIHALGALGVSSAIRHLKKIIENQQESLPVQQAAREVSTKLELQKSKGKSIF